MAAHPYPYYGDLRYILVFDDLSGADFPRDFPGALDRLCKVLFQDGKGYIGRPGPAHVLHYHVYYYVIYRELFEYYGRNSGLIRHIANSDFRFVLLHGDTAYVYLLHRLYLLG